MSHGGHPTPDQIRSRLDHPVIDGDGHWVEFDPVFGERMRKVGGDLAADGFLAAMQTTRDALSMSVAERQRRRIAQPAFWSRQAENTLDRATAMMPRLLYERLRRDRHRLRNHLPDRRPAPAAHPRRRDPAGRDPRPQHRDRRVLPRPRRPHDAGCDHPHAHAGRGHRGARVRHPRARVKVGMFGSGMSRRVAASDATDPDAARLAVWYDVLALDSDHDYDPVWAKCQELGIAPTFHSSGSNQGLRLSPVELRLQPHRPLRRRRPRGLQGDLPGRRDPALPRAAVRLPRGRRRLGVPALRRPDRALGAAQRARPSSGWTRASSTARSC